VPFTDWAALFGGDARLTAALLDRLAFHAQVIAFTGGSYRLAESVRRQTAKHVIISLACFCCGAASGGKAWEINNYLLSTTSLDCDLVPWQDERSDGAARRSVALARGGGLSGTFSLPLPLSPELGERGALDDGLVDRHTTEEL
jgi:hypothetical protein